MTQTINIFHICIRKLSNGEIDDRKWVINSKPSDKYFVLVLSCSNLLVIDGLRD